MITPADFEALTGAQRQAHLDSLPLSERYLVLMQAVWATEPWKECPGGWSWEIVMQGYENICRMEAVRE